MHILLIHTVNEVSRLSDLLDAEIGNLQNSISSSSPKDTFPVKFSKNRSAVFHVRQLTGDERKTLVAEIRWFWRITAMTK